MDQRHRDRMVDGFAEWLADRGDTAADAHDLGMLLDWKRDYGDNQPYRWRLADIDEFLLGHCPRKVSAAPDLAAGIPAGVAGAMAYLGEQGLLRRGSEPATRLAEHALSLTDEFMDAMSDPTLFGMAKSMFALGGGLEPDFDPSAPGAMDRLVELANSRMSDVPATPSPITVGPVTMPGDGARRESAAAAPALRRFGLLHQACATPGLALTKTGNLRLADARRLIEVLDTGDVPDHTIGDHTYSLRSAAHLRGLSRWIEWALAAGVVRRHRGRLVAVGTWLRTAKDPVTALDRAVDGLQRIGPVSMDQRWEVTARLAMFVEDGAGRVLAELLGAGEPVEVDAVGAMFAEVVGHAFPLPSFLPDSFVPSLARDLLDRFAECGVVQVDGVTVEPGEAHLSARRCGGTVRLTPAGIPVAVRLAGQLGIGVLERPDPATATAAQLTDLIGVVAEEEWVADARTWSADRDAGAAAAELVATLAGRQDAVVLGGLEALHTVFGAAAIPAIRTLLGGPSDAVTVLWLSQAGQLDPTGIDPSRLLAGATAMLTALLDVDGIDAVIGALDSEHGDAALATIEELWRSAHPRTGEVLTAIGTHHPDKRIAKAAKKAAFKFNSRTT